MYIVRQKGCVTVPTEFKQIYPVPFSKKLPAESFITYVESSAITPKDMEIIKFLYFSRTATENQLERIGRTKKIPISRPSLERLCKLRVINYFFVGDQEEKEKGSVPTDAYRFYVLDRGGAIILENYTQEGLYDWEVTTNLKSTEKVTRECISTELYTRIMETCPEKLVYFRTKPSLKLTTKPFIPDFDFCLKGEESDKYFVGLVIRKEDSIRTIRDKVKMYESVLGKNRWKSYYCDSEKEPTLIIICEDDDVVLIAAKMISATTVLSRYRFTTDEKMQKTLYEKGAFLSYDTGTNLIKEVSFKTLNPSM